MHYLRCTLSPLTTAHQGGRPFLVSKSYLQKTQHKHCTRYQYSKRGRLPDAILSTELLFHVIFHGSATATMMPIYFRLREVQIFLFFYIRYLLPSMYLDITYLLINNINILYSHHIIYKYLLLHNRYVGLF